MAILLNVVELECSACGKKYDASVEQHVCSCGKPVLARYDLRRAAVTLTLENLKSRPRTLWRYAEVLPSDPPVSLGEGMTALVHAERLGASIRCGQGESGGWGWLLNWVAHPLGFGFSKSAVFDFLFSLLVAHAQREGRRGGFAA
jgi:hypothetical protein